MSASVGPSGSSEPPQPPMIFPTMENHRSLRSLRNRVLPRYIPPPPLLLRSAPESIPVLTKEVIYIVGPKNPYNPSKPFNPDSLLPEFIGTYVGPKYAGGNYKGLNFKDVQYRRYRGGTPVYETLTGNHASEMYIDPESIDKYVFTPYTSKTGGRRRIRKTRHRHRHRKVRKTRRRN